MTKQIDETSEGSSHSFGESSVSFEELGIESKIRNAISEMGFLSPTPIQIEVIPCLIANKNDLIGLAQTGTGKTAAFGLPLIQEAKGDISKTKALILSPTRELCLQITKDLKNFSKYKKGIRVVSIYGGANIENQIKQLKEGAQIIVATPGRMLDMINRGKADISQIETLVLDEADEMLKMGFKEELDSILENTPPSKRTLLFSATMSREIQRIALKYMHDPIEITIGKKNQGAENVSHIYYLVHAKDRYLALKRIADYNPNIYSLVFCRTRADTQEIADKLMRDGYNADSLHGDLSQAQRDNVMQKFRTRTLKMLVATDVAARGLDVDGLTHIINYNLPENSEQYTHRSGRTGRAGKSGVSISLVNLKEKYKIKHLEKCLGKKFKQNPVPSGREICEKQLFHYIDRMEKVEVNNQEIENFLPTVYKKLEWLNREELIKRFVSIEFNYFLNYYKDAHDINVASKNERVKNPTPSQGMCRFFINLGRRDSLTPQNLIGLVNDISRRLSIKIGKIDIMNSFSFFEADAQYKEDILNSFNTKKFKGQKIITEEAEPYTDRITPSTKKDRSEGKEKFRDKKSRHSNKNKEKNIKKKKKKDKKTKGNPQK